MITIHPIPAFNDNYIWLLHNNQHSSQVTVVDPGDALPVMNYLKQHDLTLSSILITHHHHDHTNGIPKLLTRFPTINIYGPTTISAITHPVSGHDTITLPNLDNTPIQIMTIPGHTLDHIAYYTDEFVLCGDTLFSAGCGRLFEGTAEQMYNSLQKLAHLNPDTHVYCAHEYTLANLRFAQAVEPQNSAIINKIQSVTRMREQNKPSLPSSIGDELTLNPFLRCHVSTVIQAAEHNCQQTLDNPVAVFAALRQWKDHFS